MTGGTSLLKNGLDLGFKINPSFFTISVRCWLLNLFSIPTRVKEEVKESQKEEHRFHYKTIEVNPNLQLRHDSPITVQQT